MMKKLLLFALLYFAAMSIALAQGSFISFSLGPSVPLGSLAGTGNLPDNGFARTGSAFALEYAKLFGPVGLGANLSWGNHPLKADALNEAMARQNAYGSYTDSSVWGGGALMVGPSYMARKGNFTFEGKLMGGLLLAKYPDLRFANNLQMPVQCRKFNNNPFDCVGVPGYMLGFNVRYNVPGRHLAFLLRTQFYHGKTSYKLKYDNMNEGGLVTEEVTTFTQKASIFDIGVGLGWRLGKAM